MTRVGYLQGWVTVCCGARLQRNIVTYNDGGPDAEFGICSKCQSVLLCKAQESEVETAEETADSDDEHPD
jgi:hypothetical protein